MKTIEEAAKEHIESVAKRLAPYMTLSHKSLDNAFKAGVEFAQRWIPVEESLPEINDDVIVKSIESKCKYLIIQDVDDIDIHEISFMATHWRKIELT